MRHLILLFAVALLLLGCTDREASEPGQSVNNTAFTTDPPNAPTTTVLVPVGLASGIAACELLSAADLEAVTGDAFAKGEVTASQPDLSRCAWVPRDGAAGGISLSILEPTADEAWRNYLAREETTPVEGIADGALLNLALLDFVVRKGNRVAVIHFERPEHREHIPEWGRAIAERIASKI